MEEFVITAPVTAPGTPNGSFALRPSAPELPADAPAPRGTGLLGRLSMAEWLLKHRDYLLDEIEQGREIPVILADLLVVSFVPTAFYGLVIGVSTGSMVRIVSNPIKLPLMLIVTLCLCLPSLYVFSSYLGGRRSFLQTTAVAFTATAIIGVILAAFAPITWYLTFTAPHAHALHVLVNVAVFAIAGFTGVQFLAHGTKRLHTGTPQLAPQMMFLCVWVVVYGLVGLQMGYLFSPFFGSSDVWFSQHGPGQESVFVALGRLAGQLFR
jgi:hypothetical protein